MKPFIPQETLEHLKEAVDLTYRACREFHYAGLIRLETHPTDEERADAQAIRTSYKTIQRGMNALLRLEAFGRKYAK